ncbi:fasciclin domain-containing protein [Arachidicoccus ginsenosidivorans]|nr:fasciclin domain-containing protein [Arachidicoccus ginsenosidivorans]
MDYLRSDSLNRFTQLVKIIDRAAYATELNTYGTYTLFAPTDSAVNRYLMAHNIASIEGLTKEQWQEVLKFHLLEESLPSSTFTDGKLPAITDYGQYLITGIKNVNGVSSYFINRQALVTQANITVGNGIIHAVDHVLEPSVSTIAELLSKDTTYSIFTQAVKETGFYDTLNAMKDQGVVRSGLR